jgi:methionyl-tRNA formyltransferase
MRGIESFGRIYDAIDMRLALCGYGEICVSVLRQAAADPDIEDMYLLTHEPVSRVGDIRQVANELRVPWTTRSVNQAELPFQPDVISSVGYRNIIRPHIIDLVGGAIFNLHPSLLPRHRGCSSVPWAIIDGDAETGVTAHYIDAGIDTGKVILQSRIAIEAGETQLSLYRKCIKVAGEVWRDALTLVAAGEPGVEQSETGASYHSRGAPYGGQIDDAWPDAQIERFIRAMTFPPLPYATYRGQEVRTFADFVRIRSELQAS